MTEAVEVNFCKIHININFGHSGQLPFLELRRPVQQRVQVRGGGDGWEGHPAGPGAEAGEGLGGGLGLGEVSGHKVR